MQRSMIRNIRVEEEEDIPQRVGEMPGVCEGNHIGPIW